MNKWKERDVLNNRRNGEGAESDNNQSHDQRHHDYYHHHQHHDHPDHEDHFTIITREKSNLLSKARAPPRPIWQRTSEPDVVKKLELYIKLDFCLFQDAIYGPAIENGYFNSEKHLLSFCWGLQMMMYSLGKNWGTVRCKWSHSERNFDLHHNYQWYYDQYHNHLHHYQNHQQHHNEGNYTKALH